MTEPVVESDRSRPPPLQDHPLQQYRCTWCDGTGVVVKRFHMIFVDQPKWIVKKPDINNEICPACKGQRVVWR